MNQNANNPGDSKKTLWIALAVVAVLLIGGYFYMQNKNGGMTPATTEGAAPVSNTTSP